jgi:hypothetical protein
VGRFSPFSFSNTFFAELKPFGIHFVVLYGPEEACYQSFLKRHDGLTREQKSNKQSWLGTNRYWHDTFKPDDFVGNAINLFNGDERRPDPEILSEAQRIIAIG